MQGIEETLMIFREFPRGAMGVFLIGWIFGIVVRRMDRAANERRKAGRDGRLRY
jgi:hypothetical protein